MKNFKWDKKYLYWGITGFLVVVTSIIFFWLLSSLPAISGLVSLMISALEPVIYGILIAYLLNRVLIIFENKVFIRLTRRMFKKSPVKAKKAARIFSIILIMVLLIWVLAGLMIIVLPEIFASVEKLVLSSQDYLTAAINWIQEVLDGYALEDVAVEWVNSISGSLINWLQTKLLPGLGDVIANITGGMISVIATVVDIFIGLIISVYVMYNKEIFCAQVKKVVYSVFGVRTANVIIAETKAVDDAFGNYIVGTLIDAVIVGLLNYIFMMLMGMPYVVLITLLVSLTNIIPMFGPLIGAVPSTLLLLLENPTQALIFVIFTVILQQVDGQILKPRIHAARTGLSGFWIMFAILFFGGLFGLVGMLIGVPLTTVLYSIIKRVNNRRLRRRGLPEDTAFYRDIDHIDRETKKPVYKRPELHLEAAGEDTDVSRTVEATEAVTEAATEAESDTGEDGKSE